MFRNRFNCWFAFILFVLSAQLTARIEAQRAGESDLAAGGGFSSSSISTRAVTQVTGGEPGGQVPQPGQAGSPFSVDHFYKRLGLDLGGGYSPVLNKGAGYYGPGFTATIGVVDHLTPHWDLLAEVQVLGQHGRVSNGGSVGSFVEAFHLDPVYDLRPSAATSLYLVGGVGFYHLGTHYPCSTSVSGSTEPCNGSANPFITDASSANGAGFNFGGGVRHHLFADRHTELFIEARYHYLVTGSTSVGQVSFLPISAGMRW